jgi:hypothetical protein
MKKLTSLTAALLLCFALPVINTGCNTNQQTIAYNTLYSVQKSTVGAYSAYLELIVQDKISAAGLVPVSTKFEKFQASYLVALDAVQYNTNALAPTSLIVEAGDLVNLINQFKK